MAEEHEQPSGDGRSASILEVDFALVISRLIETAQKDPVQLRSSIYELARLKLLDQVATEESSDRYRMIEALETAIDGVEAFSQRQEKNPLTPFPAQVRPQSQQLTASDVGSDRRSVLVNQSGHDYREPAVQSSPRSFGSESVVQVNVMSAKEFSLKRALLIVGIIGALVMGAVYLRRHSERLNSLGEFAQNWRGLGGSLVSRPEVQTSVSANQSATVDQSLASVQQNSPLLPKAFGVYAISADQLFELEPLPGRAPDLRIAISPAITSPSRSRLPEGKVRFIVYRRDSANNAPERADVRVIAKVVSSMSFANAGKPTVTPTQDTWVMRNVAFGYRVAPVKDEADMYEIRNESDNFTLSPGRYALVVKGTAYDFDVVGEVTDPNHCLQRIEAANGAFYGACEKH
jgi:hypothetical protein